MSLLYHQIFFVVAAYLWGKQYIDIYIYRESSDLKNKANENVHTNQ